MEQISGMPWTFPRVSPGMPSQMTYSQKPRQKKWVAFLEGATFRRGQLCWSILSENLHGSWRAGTQMVEELQLWLRSLVSDMLSVKNGVATKLFLYRGFKNWQLCMCKGMAQTRHSLVMATSLPRKGTGILGNPKWLLGTKADWTKTTVNEEWIPIAHSSTHL